MSWKLLALILSLTLLHNTFAYIDTQCEGDDPVHRDATDSGKFYKLTRDKRSTIFAHLKWVLIKLFDQSWIEILSKGFIDHLTVDIGRAVVYPSQVCFFSFYSLLFHSKLPKIKLRDIIVNRKNVFIS